MYMSYREAIAMLTTEEKGILLEAIINHHAGDDLPELPPSVKMLFSIIKPQFDRDEKKYQDMIKRNKTNGEKGGRPPKNPNNPPGLSGNPNDDDNDSDDENKNENKNVDEIDNAAGPANYDRELNNIIEIYFSFFNKGKLKSKSINQAAVKSSWDRAIRKYSAIQIGEIFRKAWKSDYLKEKGELPWMLDHLEEIHFGKYANHKQDGGNQVFDKLPDPLLDGLQF